MKMEEFPKHLIDLFTPVVRSKEDLLKDFKNFIQEVNELEAFLNKSTSNIQKASPPQ